MLAVVTGASSGIGYSLAKELANRGYDLIICSAGDRLAVAGNDLRKLGVHVVEVVADLAAPQGVMLLWDRIKELGRPIDIACLNAGVGVGGLFHETNLEAELTMINLNCVGTVHLAKYLTQDMVTRKRGKMLFTASIAGEMVAPREAVYAATKAFVLSFAHSLRYELRDSDVDFLFATNGPNLVLA
jgi:short-subunit dehydrogenase